MSLVHIVEKNLVAWLTTASFVYNGCNLSYSGALWPGMKPESGLIQTPSPSQHSVLTCTTGLTTSQSSPAHYSYPIQGKGRHGFFYLRTSSCNLVKKPQRGQHVFVSVLCMLLFAWRALLLPPLLLTVCLLLYSLPGEFYHALLSKPL